MFNYHEIESFKSIRTPFYYYDLAALQQNLDVLGRYTSRHKLDIHYAIKANNNQQILLLIQQAGLGADCVSGGEIKRALEVGFPANKIVFAGVGKTDEEIQYALSNNISSFNVESLQELMVINEISGSMGLVAPVVFRINPDVDGNTNRKITTGTRNDKFGIPRDEIFSLLEQLPSFHHINFKGLHFHIGSQITDMEVFRRLAGEINIIQQRFINAGFIPQILNLGGGLGVNYDSPDEYPIPDYEKYFNTYLDHLNILPRQKIHFELGRSIVAHCGSLISKVLYLKDSDDLTFAILDAGMNDLMRPALYQASHKIQNITGIGMEKTYQVAGPICESSDIFGKDVQLPQLERGDLIAIRTAGAYGQVMSSSYNLRQPAKAIYSSEIQLSNNQKHEMRFSSVHSEAINQ